MIGPDRFVELTSFRRADLAGADLAGSTFRHCSFECAVLVGADLSEARLVNCSFRDAELRDARFTEAITLDSSFRDADLTGVRDITTARELVVELLRRGVGDDLDALGVVGAILLERAWCWEEWVTHLDDSTDLLDRFAAIFAGYPQAGCVEALRAARSCRP